MKKPRKIDNKLNNISAHSCMAQRQNRDERLSGGNFSLKSFVIEIIIGVIGGIGVWYFNTPLEAAGSGAGMEFSKIWPLLICVILLIIGIDGIFDLIKKILGLKT